MNTRYRRSYWFPTPEWVQRCSKTQLASGSILFFIALPFGMVAAVAALYWFLANLAFSPGFWTALFILAIFGLFRNK